MTSRGTGRRSGSTRCGKPTPFRWRMLVTLAGLLTILAVARPDAAEINVNDSLSSGAIAGPVALHHVTVTIYKSRTVPFERPFTKAIVGSNEIADLLPTRGRTSCLL